MTFSTNPTLPTGSEWSGLNCIEAILRFFFLLNCFRGGQDEAEAMRSERGRRDETLTLTSSSQPKELSLEFESKSPEDFALSALRMANGVGERKRCFDSIFSFLASEAVSCFPPFVPLALSPTS